MITGKITIEAPYNDESYSASGESIYSRVFKVAGFNDKSVEACIEYAIKKVHFKIDLLAYRMELDIPYKTPPVLDAATEISILHDVWRSDWYRVAKTGCCGK